MTRPVNHRAQGGVIPSPVPSPAQHSTAGVRSPLNLQIQTVTSAQLENQKLIPVPVGVLSEQR